MSGMPSRPEIFQPALPLRGVTLFTVKADVEYPFQPALPLRGVTGFDNFTLDI